MPTQSMYIHSASCLTIILESHINIQYTYVVGKYNIYLRVLESGRKETIYYTLKSRRDPLSELKIKKRPFIII